MGFRNKIEPRHSDRSTFEINFSVEVTDPLGNSVSSSTKLVYESLLHRVVMRKD